MTLERVAALAGVVAVLLTIAVWVKRGRILPA